MFWANHATISQHADALLADLIKSWTEGDSLGNLSTNEISCVLWLKAGKASVILTGDSTCDALSSAVQEYKTHHQATAQGAFPAHIVKAPHHGALGCSSVSLWKEILHPKGLVVVSAGNHQGYGHPDQAMIDHVRTSRPMATFYCTNICPTLRKERPRCRRAAQC